MRHPRDRNRPSREVPGPVVPGSDLYRLLEMVAEEIARSRVRGSDERTEKPSSEPDVDAAPAPEQGPPE